MPSVKEVLAPISLNIAEEKGWEPYDPAGNILEWSSDNAYEAFRALGPQECREWLDDVLDVGTGSVKDWSPKKGPAVTEAQADFVCSAMMEKGGVLDSLEPLKQLIIDALTWMYEAAYMPHDSDLEWALEQAQESAIDSVELDEEVWEPLLKEFPEEEILKQIADAVTYYRRENMYERFLKLDPSKIVVVKNMLSLIKRGRGNRDLTQSQSRYDLRSDLESVFDDVEGYFWNNLEKQMQEVDLDSRTDWKASWTSKLQDKVEVRHATVGVQKFIAEEYREDESDA